MTQFNGSNELRSIVVKFLIHDPIAFARKVIIGNKIASILIISNFFSMAMSFAGTAIIAWVFAIEDIGKLGFVTSVTLLIAPFVSFRLDLAFERQFRKQAMGLVIIMHAFALLVSLFIIISGYLLHDFIDIFYFEDVVFIGLNLMTFCSFTAIWSWLISRRNIVMASSMHFFRIILSVIIPFVLRPYTSDVNALIFGAIISQLVGIFYLLVEKKWQDARIVYSFENLLSRQSHLFLPMSIPVFLNLLSVYIGPILSSFVFSERETGILWLLIRFIYTPATLFCDPIRRGVFSKYSSIDKISPVVIRNYSLFFWGCFLASAVGCVGVFLASGWWSQFAPSALTAFLNGLMCAFLWAGAVVGNAPTTAIVPTLKFTYLPSVSEVVGILLRTLSICAGLLGLAFTESVFLFFFSMLIVNIGWGIVIRKTAMVQIQGRQSQKTGRGN